MPIPADAVPAALVPLVDRALARLALSLADSGSWPPPAEVLDQVRLLAITSDFAIDTLCRQPALLSHLTQEGCPPLPLPALDPLQPSEWQQRLRRYRTAASTRLIWRDLAGLDDVPATLAGATALAEDCLGIGLAALEQEFATRHGVVRAVQRPAPQTGQVAVRLDLNLDQNFTVSDHRPQSASREDEACCASMIISITICTKLIVKNGKLLRLCCRDRICRAHKPEQIRGST